MNSQNWHTVTLIKAEMISNDVKSLVFKPKIAPHIAGQHYSIKLTTNDGYIAERDYSIANPPEQSDVVEFGIQLLQDGEVSPHLFQLKPGDQVQVKGPIGRSFIWEAKTDNNPLLLIAGGSGMVPLRSMLLHHFNNYKPRDVIFLISCKTEDDILYKKEIEQLTATHPDFKLIYTLTEKAPDNFNGYTRRVDKEMVQEIFEKYKDQNPSIYICGPTPFVEAVSIPFLNLGFDPNQIKTERFG